MPVSAVLRGGLIARRNAVSQQHGCVKVNDCRRMRPVPDCVVLTSLSLPLNSAWSAILNQYLPAGLPPVLRFLSAFSDRFALAAFAPPAS